MFALVAGCSVLRHPNLPRNQMLSLDINCPITLEDEICWLYLHLRCVRIYVCPANTYFEATNFLLCVQDVWKNGWISISYIRKTIKTFKKQKPRNWRIRQIVLPSLSKFPHAHCLWLFVFPIDIQILALRAVTYFYLLIPAQWFLGFFLSNRQGFGFLPCKHNPLQIPKWRYHEVWNGRLWVAM